MKKLMILIAFMGTVTATAMGKIYLDDYGYSRAMEKQMETADHISTFFLIVGIAYIVLSVIVLVRWWKMTKVVNKIYEITEQNDYSIFYLASTGRMDEARDKGIKELYDALVKVYFDEQVWGKEKEMDKEIALRLPTLTKIGIEVPDFMTSGEKFVNHFRELTGIVKGSTQQ